MKLFNILAIIPASLAASRSSQGLTQSCDTYCLGQRSRDGYQLSPPVSMLTLASEACGTTVEYETCHPPTDVYDMIAKTVCVYKAGGQRCNCDIGYGKVFGRCTLEAVE